MKRIILCDLIFFQTFRQRFSLFFVFLKKAVQVIYGMIAVTGYGRQNQNEKELFHTIISFCFYKLVFQELYMEILLDVGHFSKYQHGAVCGQQGVGSNS